MQLPEILSLEDWPTKLAGVLGAAVSMSLIKGTLPKRLGLAACGFIISGYFSDWVAMKTGLPEGAAGFLLGLFGMSIVSRAWQFVEEAPISAIWQAGIDRIKGKSNP